MKVSLIMPTIGRVEEISSFLSSIKYNDDVSVLIADQNTKGWLPIDQLSKSKDNNVTINYFHSETKGLSFNRNFLIKKNNFESEIIAFPDDDCTYYSDTLTKVEDFFINNPHVDVVIGCIYDRSTNEYRFKPWPKVSKKINKMNFYLLASSITIFSRQPLDFLFDQNLGAGTENGSCEDPDFLYNMLKKGKVIYYEPTIQVWHPAPDFNSITLEKTYSYAKGFGYFIRKDLDFFKLCLLSLLISKKIMQLVLKNKEFRKGYFRYFFSGLYDGLFKK
ncbi:glycosyltransferase family 2 protein [Obesumbacterium proteus]|uniref:glycosyltransferase family 2 protein n=1 Tax=Obesumbacterium proteus TaxID=82983 RepID=UPI00242AB330|nr:glycosyltransferase family 2 protein [Obesumbacterium proteus]